MSVAGSADGWSAVSERERRLTIDLPLDRAARTLAELSARVL
jgi:hypothetical protein